MLVGRRRCTLAGRLTTELLEKAGAISWKTVTSIGPHVRRVSDEIQFAPHLAFAERAARVDCQRADPILALVAAVPPAVGQDR